MEIMQKHIISIDNHLSQQQHHHLFQLKNIEKTHLMISPLKSLKNPIFSKSRHASFVVSSSSEFEEAPISYSPYDYARKLVQEFKPKIPIEKALTPPSSWYTDPAFHALELQQVFHKGWQAVGYIDQIKEQRQYFTGRLGSIEYVVCRDDSDKLRGFHNVCRHHASLLASGSGKKSCFVCPYHGWTYGLDGVLQKATRIRGIENFELNGRKWDLFHCK